MTDVERTMTCFVVMPITVPKHLEARYGERLDHFTKIYSALISPAIVEAGLTPLSPARSGTENIQAAIINDLQGADLVVADLSSLNPNVFLELGIRSALDRPVCLIYDGLDALPFDSGTLNTHRYDPHPLYELNDEIQRMAEFISATVAKSDGRNELWKFFGSASATLPVAELDPEDASLIAKVDRLLDLVEHQSSGFVSNAPQIAPVVTDTDLLQVIDHVTVALTEAGSAGVHGSRIRSICLRLLGGAYPSFLDGETLSGRLSRLGVDIRTNSSGQFFLGPSPE